MVTRRSAALVAALVASTVTFSTAHAAPAGWEDSPVHAKWQALGGASFAGEKVGDEVVLDNGIRWAKFAKYDIVITWREGAGAHWMSGAISRLWLGTSPAVAAATMDQVPVSRGSQAGAAIAYDTGYSVYYSDAYGAFPISGAERDKYWANGSVTGKFGWPVSGPLPTPQVEGGIEQRFSEAVSLFHQPGKTEAFWISGALRDKYRERGGSTSQENWLVADQVAQPGNGWKAEMWRGAIFWSAPTGAHWVSSRLTGGTGGYEEQGGPGGRFGYPEADTQELPYGHRTEFVNGYSLFDGTFFHPTPAFWMGRGLRDAFDAHGGTEGFLKWPASNQTPATGTDGQYALFYTAHVQDKVLLWGPRTGGYVVRQRFLEWLRGGGDVAVYGLPQNDQTTVGEYEFQQFENVSIFLSATRGVTIGGEFRDLWWQTGGMQSPLGMATDFPKTVENNVKRQDFDHGWIQCDYNIGKCTYGLS